MIEGTRVRKETTGPPEGIKKFPNWKEVFDISRQDILMILFSGKCQFPPVVNSSCIF
jgi:hypothetical protein